MSCQGSNISGYLWTSLGSGDFCLDFLDPDSPPVKAATPLLTSCILRWTSILKMTYVHLLIESSIGGILTNLTITFKFSLMQV